MSVSVYLCSMRKHFIMDTGFVAFEWSLCTAFQSLFAHNSHLFRPITDLTHCADVHTNRMAGGGLWVSFPSQGIQETNRFKFDSSTRMSQSSDYQTIISAFIEYVRPQFVLVVGITPFCACLVTLLAVLFAFSTPLSRKLLVFKLNVLAICIALVTGTLNGYLNALGVLEPFSPMPSLGICFTFAFFALLSPLFYDSILLHRLLAFYPINSTPLRTVAKVLVLPICVKVGRLVLVVRLRISARAVLQ